MHRMEAFLHREREESVTQQYDTPPLQERVSLILEAGPTLVPRLIEIEQAGMDHVWVGTGPISNPDLLIRLAAAAARTTRLKLGTAIIPISTRHPVFMAQQALAFHLEAPDRLLLGIGPGSTLLAKQIYHMEMEPPLAYLREYIQVLRPALHEGEVHHQGRFFTADVKLAATAQIPLLVSALGPGAFRLAGAVADGAIPFLCPLPYLLETALPAMSAAAAAANRPRPKLVAHVSVALSEDTATVFQTARRTIGFYGFSEEEIQTGADRLLTQLIISGSESKVRDRLQELLATEIDELMISLTGVADPGQEYARLVRMISQL
jgi:alkanesulfonate monooxygenase SsuD/methylene tetrahydromethanopterin reductase-like flavin-dependent oxidoreductase (luciferase family)